MKNSRAVSTLKIPFNRIERKAIDLAAEITGETADDFVRRCAIEEANGLEHMHRDAGSLSDMKTA